MKRIALLALAMTALFSGTAMASGHHQHTKVVSDCVHAHYKPDSIVIYCDQTLALTKITYTKWGTSVAKGTDRTYQDDCKPSCAAGHPVFHHDHFTLYDPRNRHGMLIFTRVKVFRNGHLYQSYPLSTPS
ncbi:MAG TPA: hypothetical protein VHD81_05020 [Mycobacteriales bacterium]|nr:hypothetical protein [Mycobacteriales bacterium]